MAGEKYYGLGLLLLLAVSFGSVMPAAAGAPATEIAFSEYEDVVAPVSDPLEKVNRVVFVFNDRLQVWVMEPLARGYRRVTPSPLRQGLLNFFNNLLEPARVLNCLLQGRFAAAAETFSRFALNSTAGCLGLMDPASWDGLATHEFQFASTLAAYGVGHGPYLVLPFWGASDLRGAIGLCGDTLASPLFYALRGDPLAALAVQGSNAVNRTSFRLGEYQKMLSGALDPYIAVRDAYRQHQNNLLDR